MHFRTNKLFLFSSKKLSTSYNFQIFNEKHSQISVLHYISNDVYETWSIANRQLTSFLIKSRFYKTYKTQHFSAKHFWTIFLKFLFSHLFFLIKCNLKREKDFNMSGLKFCNKLFYLKSILPQSLNFFDVSLEVLEQHLQQLQQQKQQQQHCKACCEHNRKF